MKELAAVARKKKKKENAFEALPIPALHLNMKIPIIHSANPSSTGSCGVESVV